MAPSSTIRHVVSVAKVLFILVSVLCIVVSSVDGARW
jgi:hypothetical protein